MFKYYYLTNEAGSAEDLDDAYEFEATVDTKWPEWLAGEAAEDYHDNHDGWESEWPLVFHIWDKDKNFIGKFEVDREYSPEFSAREIE